MVSGQAAASRRSTAQPGSGRSGCSGCWGDLDGVSEGLQLTEEVILAAAMGETAGSGEVVGPKIVELHAVAQDVPGDDDQVVGDRDGCLAATLLAEPPVQAAEPGAEVGAGAGGGPRRSTSAVRSSRLPLRVRVLPCLPADSLLPGHNPAQDARWAAVGNRAMSTPIV